MPAIPAIALNLPIFAKSKFISRKKKTLNTEVTVITDANEVYKKNS